MKNFMYYWNNERQVWNIKLRFLFFFWTDECLDFDSLDSCRYFVECMNKKP